MPLNNTNLNYDTGSVFKEQIPFCSLFYIAMKKSAKKCFYLLQIVGESHKSW